MKDRYLFAHIFTINSAIYNKSIQKLIKETQNVSEHIFIYIHEDSYLLVKNENFENSFLDNSPCTAELIRKYLGSSDFVFIHSMDFPNKEIVKLSDEEISRCVWSVWGPDLYRNNMLRKKHSFFYTALRSLYHLARYRHIYTSKKLNADIDSAEKKLNKLRAICAGFEGDIDEIKRRFPNVPAFQALYPNEYFLSDIEVWERKYKIENQVPHTKTRILLGHCAMRHLQHKKWLKKLAAVKDSVEIYLPLNYGSEKYADKIQRMAESIFGNSTIVFRERLSTEEYFQKVLSQVDVAIFDFDIQSAYGNALLLLYLDRKIYYPKNSAMYQGLTKQGACVYKIEDIDLKNVSSLAQNQKNKVNVDFARKRFEPQLYKTQWGEVFNMLKKD